MKQFITTTIQLSKQRKQDRVRVVTETLTFPTDNRKSALNDRCDATIDHDGRPLVHLRLDERNGPIEFDLGILLEDEAVTGASEMEHSQLITVMQGVPLLNNDLATGYLEHAYANKTYESDFGVIGLDVDENSGSDVWEESDRQFIRGWVVGYVGVIGPRDLDNLLHSTFHWAVPTVIVARTKICLEGRSTHEFVNKKCRHSSTPAGANSFIFDAKIRSSSCLTRVAIR
jgi:hypothetical protein